jgi:hypothetical protein
MKSSFLDRFSKNTVISNFVQIRPVEAYVLHADEWIDRQTDRQTDMTKLIVAFRSFANAPKKHVVKQK